MEPLRPSPLLLTVSEAARRLSLSRSVVYELVLGGEIQSIKVGRSRRVLAGALTDFIAQKVKEQEA